MLFRGLRWIVALVAFVAAPGHAAGRAPAARASPSAASAAGTKQAKAQRLAALAEQWRRREQQAAERRYSQVERQVAKGQRPGEELDVEQLPDRTRTSRILREALRLDPNNVHARCLLALNLVDAAYVGEGEWDRKAVETSLLPHLKRLDGIRGRGSLTPQERRSLGVLRSRLRSEIGATNDPALAPLRQWWKQGRGMLRSATPTDGGESLRAR